MATTERSFVDNVWDFFCSLKLTLFLLFSMALTSIIGTILPQGALPPEYVASISQSKLQIYTKLGFFDMYHSWWFIALLYIFCINLISCSIKRLPHVFRFVSQPTLVLGDSARNSSQLKSELTFSGAPDKAKSRLSEFLGKEFATPVVTEHNGEFHLFAQKTAWSRLGVYVVHFSILVIFVGSIIGSLYGYKGYVNIEEGTSINAVGGRNGNPIPLGFDVRCEKFSVEFYTTGAPKEFKSLLTVLENGRPVPGYSNVKVIVNDPLTYKGITFYQSSYGQAKEGGEHFITATPRGGGVTEKIALREGTTIGLKDGSTLKLMETTQEVRQFAPGFTGPAARVELSRPGSAPQIFIVFKDFPEVNAKRGDAVIFGYEGTNAKMYTGLQVAKDPGVWVVWLGCALMVVGLGIAFFMSHKRIWIVISHGHARIYGNVNKNQTPFGIKFEALSEKFKQIKI